MSRAPSPVAAVPPALCACGKPLRHRGVCKGTRFGTRGPGPPIAIIKASNSLASRRDTLREKIRELQVELLAIEAKLNALKAVEAAYLPDPDAAKPTAPPPFFDNPFIGNSRPFRIGERG